VQQVKHLGYLVIEWPESARNIAGWCSSNLAWYSTTIIKVLAGHRSNSKRRTGGYFSRAIGRWHWFGEKCLGKWNPHFNVLVDFDSLSSQVKTDIELAIDSHVADLSAGKQTKKTRKELRGLELYRKGVSGYMPKPLLEKLQADLRGALNCPDLIVHYSYFDKPGQMVQKVRYVTRATFRDYSWNPYMARELFKFRNTRWWGKWLEDKPENHAWELHEAQAEGEDIAGLELVASLQKHVCPDCGRPLKPMHVNKETGEIRCNPRTGKPVVWSSPVDSVYLKLWGAREIAGTGYYRIPPGEWRGHSLSPGEFLKLEEKEARARELTGPVVTLPMKLARKRVNAYWERQRRAWEHRDNLVKTGQLSEEFGYGSDKN
jgi:hypothetical protein